ncbi:Dysbindin protein-like protein [Frankliniella fusca]|uniref:Dysbindin protein-like protein n=1 Tax=Frankliniella fusca TaxID=407009 RepID=A0AAE1HUU2_9NEOP|nr:Dysbindin protein-like protein [Frankliniella fusca]
MFDSFRDKIQSVQEGITASFQRISSGESSRPPREYKSVNINAGAELLHKYQSEWHENHQLAEENAAKAQTIDEIIGGLYVNFEKQWVNISQLTTSMAGVPQIISSTQSLMEQLGNLQEIFDEVEHNLLQLEDIIETQEHQERQLDHRFQLALYKEKKLQELERVREKLVKEYAEKMSNHERHQSQTLKERQETFGQVFQEDLEQFKQSGKLPVSPVKVSQPGPSLEEVTLDDDTVALDNFLSEGDP